MANLRSIKDRINSIKNTQKITRAMKMVAAAKVKKAESAVKSSRPFTFELYKMFSWIYKETHSDICDKLKTKEAIDNYSALLCEREIKTVGLVIISSNKGLAGAYCANIVRYSLNLIKQYLAEGKKVKVLGKFSEIKCVESGENLSFEFDGTYTTITLPEIIGFSMFVLK